MAERAIRGVVRMGVLIAAGICGIGSLVALQSEGTMSAGLWLLAGMGLFATYRILPTQASDSPEKP